MKLFTATLATILCFSVTADDSNRESVPGYFQHYLIGRKLTLCTKDNVEDAGLTTEGFSRKQHWSRKASYHDLKQNGDAFTVDYTATVDMYFESYDKDKLVRTEDKAQYVSDLRFEMSFNSVLNEYVGFARFTKSTKDGKDHLTLGRAYSARMKVQGGLVIDASEVAPRVLVAENKNSVLGMLAWNERFRWDDGVMFRGWTETDYTVDAETWSKKGQGRSSPTANDTSYCE